MKKRTNPQKPRRNGKFDHGRILPLPLSYLTPALINGKVYRPVDPADPEVHALAASIAEKGLLEPIIITTDEVIISGHRRHAACTLAGLDIVPCRRVKVHSLDPNFLPLLVEYNRQRVKSVDERLREEVILADPEESYRRLVDYRRRQSRINIDTVTIRGTKSRAKISPAKEPFLQAVLKILDERNDFWPLSDRQVHYALLNAPPLIHAGKPGSRYANDNKSYKAATELLTRARLQGRIPWEAIHDPTRPVVSWSVHREPGTFFRRELDGFLKGYYRDLMQNQPNHIEIVGEKYSIETVVRRVAADYTIPFTICRGYCSLPPRHDLAERFRASGKEKLLLLGLADFDPEGEDIGRSFARSLRDDFGIQQVEAVKVALTKGQVEEMGLAPIHKAKKSSARYDGFVAEHGDDVFELEAVAPSRLQEIMRQAIDAVIDLDAFNAEVQREKTDAARLDGVRRMVHEVLKSTNV
jgi:hypothetical protein